MSELLEDYRCACGKLLFRGLLLVGSVEVKCRECKHVSIASGLVHLSGKDRCTVVLNERGAIVKTAFAQGATGYRPEELLQLRIQDLVVVLQDDFYPALWESLDSEGRSSALIPTLQKNKDRSIHPIRMEARGAIVGKEKVLVCTLTRTAGLHARFTAGGVMEANTPLKETRV